MTVQQAAAQACADLALACDRAREASQLADGERTAVLLCRLAVEADRRGSACRTWWTACAAGGEG